MSQPLLCVRVEEEGKPAHELDFQELSAMDGQIADVRKLIPGRVGGAVRLQAILDRVEPSPEMDCLTVESTDAPITFDAVPRPGNRPISTPILRPTGSYAATS